MRKKKRNEIPDPNRAQMWLGYSVNKRTEMDERLRVVYPDGKAEFKYASSGSRYHDPCWHYDHYDMKKSIKEMKAYDKMWRRKTLFLGNI